MHLNAKHCQRVRACVTGSALSRSVSRITPTPPCTAISGQRNADMVPSCRAMSMRRVLTPTLQSIRGASPAALERFWHENFFTSLRFRARTDPKNSRKMATSRRRNADEAKRRDSFRPPDGREMPMKSTFPRARLHFALAVRMDACHAR